MNIITMLSSWFINNIVIGILGIDTWFDNLVRGAIKNNLTNITAGDGMVSINSVSEQVKFIPTDYGGVYDILNRLNKEVIIPIGIIILSSLLFYTLIDEILEKNKIQESITVEFLIKLFLKATLGLFVINNAWNISVAILDFSAQIIEKVASVISAGSTSSGTDFQAFESMIDSMSGGELMWPLVLSMIASLTLSLGTMFMYILIYSRIIEIYLLISTSAIPISTYMNKEWSQIGNNHIKKISAKGLQGVLLVMVFGIMGGLQQSILQSVGSGQTGISSAMLQLLAFSIVTIIMLSKTGSIANSIVGAN